jgi:hypothetical protein
MSTPVDERTRLRAAGRAKAASARTAEFFRSCLKFPTRSTGCLVADVRGPRGSTCQQPPAKDQLHRQLDAYLDAGLTKFVISTAAVDRGWCGLGVSALVGAVTAALFGVCEDI